MIKEELKNLDKSDITLKKFAFTIGGLLIIAAALLLYYEQLFAVIICATTGFMLVLFHFLSKKILRKIYSVWMLIATILGWLMTKIILTILFFIVVTSIGIITKLSRKNFLDLNRGNGDPTYWNKRSDSVKVKNYYERQY